MRAFNDWKLDIDMVIILLSALHKEMVTSKFDKVSWKGELGDIFSVLEAYKVLQLRSASLFPLKAI